MSRIADLVGRFIPQLRRDNISLGFADWLSYFTFGGTGYMGGINSLLGAGSTSINSKQEVPLANYESFVQQVYKTNGIVFACMVARMLPFAEARFQYRRMVKGRPGELFGDSSLGILEKPWNNATTGDLLTRTIQDADLGGNFFGARKGGKIKRMRPDWTGVLVGSQSEPDDPNWQTDSEVIGYAYWRGGYHVTKEPEILLPAEVAHFAPIPDPLFSFRGMSWLQPVINEVMGDNAATSHKLKFFENGATPNLLVNVDKTFANIDTFKAFVKKMDEEQKGVANAYKTLYLGAGSSATVIGANMRQVDFKVTQGAGETRIAAAARIPPIIVGLSEGLAAATYSNYGQARRAFADGTLRPYWRNAAGSFGNLVVPPKGAELWYDDRDIPFLQEDQKDRADIAFVEAQTLRQLIDAGYKPDSVKAAIISGDWERLEHSGLYSVQLQSPGSQKLPESVPGETPSVPIAGATPPAALGPGAPAPTVAPKAKALPSGVSDSDTPDSSVKPERVVGELVVEPTDLTAREQQVADRLARRMTNKDIARELDLSVKTVENHVNAILRKLGVNSRTDVTEVHVHLAENMVSTRIDAPITVQPAAPAEVRIEQPITVAAAAPIVVPAPKVELHQPIRVDAAAAAPAKVDIHVDATDLTPVAEAMARIDARIAEDLARERAAAEDELVTEKEVVDRDPASGLIKKSRETTSRRKKKVD